MSHVTNKLPHTSLSPSGRCWSVLSSPTTFCMFSFTPVRPSFLLDAVLLWRFLVASQAVCKMILNDLAPSTEPFLSYLPKHKQFVFKTSRHSQLPKPWMASPKSSALYSSPCSSIISAAGSTSTLSRRNPPTPVSLHTYVTICLC